MPVLRLSSTDSKTLELYKIKKRDINVVLTAPNSEKNLSLIIAFLKAIVRSDFEQKMCADQNLRATLLRISKLKKSRERYEKLAEHWHTLSKYYTLEEILKVIKVKKGFVNNLDALITLCKEGSQDSPKKDFPEFKYKDFISVAAHPGGSYSIEAVFKYGKALQDKGYSPTQIIQAASRDGGANNLEALDKHTPSLIENGYDKNQISKAVSHNGGSKTLQILVDKKDAIAELPYSREDVISLVSFGGGSNNLTTVIDYRDVLIKENGYTDAQILKIARHGGGRQNLIATVEFGKHPSFIEQCESQGKDWHAMISGFMNTQGISNKFNFLGWLYTNQRIDTRQKDVTILLQKIKYAKSDDINKMKMKENATGLLTWLSKIPNAKAQARGSKRGRSETQCLLKPTSPSKQPCYDRRQQEKPPSFAKAKDGLPVTSSSSAPYYGMGFFQAEQQPSPPLTPTEEDIILPVTITLPLTLSDIRIPPWSQRNPEEEDVVLPRLLTDCAAASSSPQTPISFEFSIEGDREREDELSYPLMI